MIDSLIIIPIKYILKTLYNFITGKSYEFLEKNILIKYSLCVIVSIVLILCLILILFNSFKGISQILKTLFNLEAYEYIKTNLNVDIQGNVDKLFIPELIVSSLGLASLISILLYIISFEKFKKKELNPSLNIEDITNDITKSIVSTPNIEDITN